MTAGDLRARFDEFWRRADREAESSKDSQGAVLALEEFYRGLPTADRSAANQLLAEWVLSEDDKRRFDALALIDRFAIREAAPALRTLAERCENSNLPSSPYDWAKVNRILGRLVGDEDARESE